MNHRFLAFLTVPALLAAAAHAQTLQHEKYTLDNGMTVILHPDHSLPRASINIWYRVGARNEPPHRSGFAHLFEHLMFMGTKRVPGSDFDVLMETGGGSNNASTSLDRTNYFSSGPSSLLPTLLWLDADRLEHMGLFMTQEKLDKQRDVVRNERRQTTEEAPYGKAYDASLQLLYPPEHPYHNGVIGTHEDLEAAKVQDVKDFFASYYQPNNASLVVAGDFDPAQIKPLVKDLFGTIPAGNVAPQAVVPMPRLDRVIRSTSFDKVQLPAIGFAYHSPGQFQEGDGELDLLAAILADGPGSRLYQRLIVKENLAAEVSASQDSSFLSSIFRVTVLAKPEADLARVEKIMDEELNRLIAEGPTQAELDQRKVTIELGKVRSLQSIEARADALNQYQYVWGTPDGLERDLNRYRNASIDAIKRTGQLYCTPNARLIQYVLPEEPEFATTPRDSKPAQTAGTPFTPMQPETFTTSGGVNVMVFNKPGLPLVNVGFIFTPGAGALEPIAQAGRSALMGQMLREGTGDMNGAAFAAAMQSLGASFNAGADHESFTVSVSGLKKNLDKAMDLATGAMLSPRMDAEDFARVKRLHIDALKQADDEPRAVAPKVANMMLFGPDHPYAYPVNGTAATVSGIDVQAIKDAHASIIQPRSVNVIIAGDITAAEAKALIEPRLATWTGSTKDTDWPKVAVPANSGGGMKVYIVNRPNAVQTMIHLRGPGIRFADTARTSSAMLNTILGGSFTSRLNQNLREKNGFTYGARSGFEMGPTLGTFSAASSVIATKTGSALTEFFAELNRIRTGDISEAEAVKARTITYDNAVEPFATLSGIVGLAGDRVESRLPWSSFGEDLAAMKTIDAAALNTLAPKAIDLDHSVLVLVGDKDLIMDQIKDLKLPTPTVVDANGKAKSN